MNKIVNSSYLYEKLVAGEVTTTSDIKIELDFNLRSGKSIASLSEVTFTIISFFS